MKKNIEIASSSHSKLILFAIIAIAFVVRIFSISSYPPSINWDEASLGYNAYSILKTGKDEWGQTFPAIFRAFGDYKLPVYIYALVPVVWVFGLNEFSTRLPSVVAGAIFVFMVYKISRKVGVSELGSLFGAMCSAVFPWNLFLSRIALEANLALSIFSLGIYFSLEKSLKYKMLSMFLFSLSAYTYNSFRVIAPLLILYVIFASRSLFIKSKKYLITTLLIISVLWIPLAGQVLRGSAGARYESVKILDAGAISFLEESRNASSLPSVLTKLIYNKYSYFGFAFVKNFISYLDPRFIFINGGSQYQFSIPNQALIPLPFAIILVLGIVSTFKKKKALLFFLLLVSFIPGSITREAPHVLRSISAMLPIFIFIAFGLDALFKKSVHLKKPITLMISILILLYSLQFLDSYKKYTNEYSQSWQFGYKQVLAYIAENEDKYENIIFTKKYGESHIFYLFYNKIDPKEFQNEAMVTRFFQTNWYWTDRYKNIFFVNDWQIPQFESKFILESKNSVDCTNTKCLLVSSEGKHPEGWSKVFEVKFLNDKNAFEVYEN